MYLSLLYIIPGKCLLTTMFQFINITLTFTSISPLFCYSCFAAYPHKCNISSFNHKFHYAADYKCSKHLNLIGDSEPNLSPLVDLSVCQYREGTLGPTAGHFSVSDRPLARPGRNKCVPLSKHLATTLSSALISQTLLLSKCDTDRSLHVHKQLLPKACCF